MVWLGACPRCRGDLLLDRDHYGEFVSCLQCGGILDESQERSLRMNNISRRLLGGPERAVCLAKATAATRLVPEWR
jgi:uncharacterized protein YbaR (Trm112 family)